MRLVTVTQIIDIGDFLMDRPDHTIESAIMSGDYPPANNVGMWTDVPKGDHYTCLDQEYNLDRERVFIQCDCFSCGDRHPF